MDAADALLTECQRLCQELGDRSLLASALSYRGRVAICRGDLTRARPLFEEALSLTRALGVRQRIAWSLLEVADAACHQYDLQAARAAGLRTAFVPRPTEDTEPTDDWDIVAASFGQLV